MKIKMIKKKSLFFAPVIFLAGALTVSAENIVPVTSLTKSCKPLINKNLKIPKTNIRGFSERSQKRISRALEKLADENYVEAIDLLKQLLESSKDQFVQASVAKFLGIAYAQQKGQANEKNATTYFSKALDLGKGFLQHKELQDLTQNVAQMLYGQDKKDKAIEYLERWMKNSNEDNHNVYLVYAAIRFDQGKARESICPAYWAAKVDKKPNKNAMTILLNAHFEFKDYVGTIALLKQLILDFPTEKGFWRNLSQVYSQEDQLDEALAVMEMFYVQGLMETENDYKMLSSMFAYNDIPFRTAVILKEGIDKGLVKDTEKNWSNIASNFHVASELEKAIDAYARAAAKSDSGEKDLKRAELLADLDKFKEAIAGFNKALQKGSLKDPGKAHFRKGLAYLGMKQYNSALTALEKATKYKKWRKQSVQWASYVRNQKKNAAKL